MENIERSKLYELLMQKQSTDDILTKLQTERNPHFQVSDNWARKVLQKLEELRERRNEQK